MTNINHSVVINNNAQQCAPLRMMMAPIATYRSTLLKAQAHPVASPGSPALSTMMLMSLLPPHTTRVRGASARSLPPAAKE